MRTFRDRVGAAVIRHEVNGMRLVHLVDHAELTDALMIMNLNLKETVFVPF